MDPDLLAEVTPYGAVLLAAGASRRLGRSKQLANFEGEPLARRAARLVLATGPADAVAVLGADEANVRTALEGLPLRIVVCAEWEQGLGRSLRQGLRTLDQSCDGALVILCDQLGLTEAHLERLVEAWRKCPLKAAASGYAGVVGVPALVPRAWFADLGTESGDRGFRDLLRARRDEVLVIHDEALSKDVDLPEDLGT